MLRISQLDPWVETVSPVSRFVFRFYMSDNVELCFVKHLLALPSRRKKICFREEEGLTRRGILGFETGNDDKEANVPMKVEIRDP